MPALLLRARGLAALAFLLLFPVIVLALLFPIVVMALLIGMVEAGVWLTRHGVALAAPSQRRRTDGPAPGPP